MRFEDHVHVVHVYEAVVEIYWLEVKTEKLWPWQKWEKWAHAQLGLSKEMTVSVPNLNSPT